MWLKYSFRWLVLLIVMHSCTSYQSAYVTSPQDELANDVIQLQFVKGKEKAIHHFKKLYGAMHVEFGTEIVFDKKDKTKSLQWIKVQVADSPRITNIGSIGYSQTFAQEIVVESSKMISNWDDFDIIIIELSKKREGMRSYMYRTDNLQEIDLRKN